MKTKTVKKGQNVYYYSKDDTLREFYCERCEQNKKSKITVKWTHKENTQLICNACYGFLLSK